MERYDSTLPLTVHQSMLPHIQHTHNYVDMCDTTKIAYIWLTHLICPGHNWLCRSLELLLRWYLGREKEKVAINDPATIQLSCTNLQKGHNCAHKPTIRIHIKGKSYLLSAPAGPRLALYACLSSSTRAMSIGCKRVCVCVCVCGAQTTNFVHVISC